MTSRLQFDQELLELKRQLIQMGDTAVENIRQGLHSFLTRNVELAQTVILNDKEVNAYEQRIEKECLRIILKEQPVARDLRLITAILKMITDVERIGDHAADISKMAILLDKTHSSFQTETVRKMTEQAQFMIKEALDSFIQNDTAKAQKVIDSDDVIDDLFDLAKQEVADGIKSGKVDPESAISYMMIAKYLERIGDHAVNLGEWVIFSITGAHKNNLIF